LIKTVKVDLSIKDNETGRYLTVPVLPETVGIDTGSKKASSVSVLDLGDVDIPEGMGLATMSWDSFFPARYDPGYCQTSKLKTPKEYKAQFDKWKREDTSLQLICPAAGINQRMYVSDFSAEVTGFEGDLEYSVSLRELRIIKARKVNSRGGSIGDSTIGKKNPRPAKKTGSGKTSSGKDRAKTYTVVKGDWLIKIAKRQGIKNWRTQLYNPNKKPKGPLGSNPNLIYPGQKLKLPK
jgi:LysM repeat protein